MTVCMAWHELILTPASSAGEDRISAEKEDKGNRQAGKQEYVIPYANTGCEVP